MNRTDFFKKTSFSKEEILGLSLGSSVPGEHEEWSRLPAPPMLMIDRITHFSIPEKLIIAEKDVKIDDWFFLCHFLKDPVQPGCLGVDAIWQLLGFYLAGVGAMGAGRALGCKEVDFFGQIRPLNKLVRYEVKIRRYQMNQANETAVVIGTGKVFVDDEHIYTITDAKVGTFLEIKYPNYPFANKNGFGGSSR